MVDSNIVLDEMSIVQRSVWVGMMEEGGERTREVMEVVEVGSTEKKHPNF